MVNLMLKNSLIALFISIFFNINFASAEVEYTGKDAKKIVLEGEVLPFQSQILGMSGEEGTWFYNPVKWKGNIFLCHHFNLKSNKMGWYCRSMD